MALSIEGEDDRETLRGSQATPRIQHPGDLKQILPATYLSHVGLILDTKFCCDARTVTTFKKATVLVLRRWE